MRTGPTYCSIAVLLLEGCTAIDAASHQSAVTAASVRQIICIDGVEYVALPVKDSWAIAPHYKPDGSLYTCSDSVARLR